MQEVVIISAARTAIGKFNGTIKDVPATQLGAAAIREAVERSGLQPEDIEECLMGNVLSASLGQNPARQAMIAAGLPYKIPAFTVNKVCGSGMKAVVLAAQAIKAGDAQVIVAGGMENMNQAPYLLPKARYGYRLGEGKLVDAMVNDGLWDYYNNFHMGITGELIAEKYGLNREEVDAFALRSNELAVKATQEGKFKNEILPLEIPQRKADPIIFDKDEGPRITPLEKLAKLPPVFKKDGLVTAANASQISDGACALTVMSEEFAQAAGITPLATIKEYESGGCEPEMVMDAPVVVTRQMFERTGLTMNDIDLVEHNEAFASASVATMKALGIPEEKFNVHGGAVALGHPIGCSGARIFTTLLHEISRRSNADKKNMVGLATLCVGVGQGEATLIESLL